MSQSPTDSTKATISAPRSVTRQSPSPRTSSGPITSPPSMTTPSTGILRISNKPRRASGSSVEFRVPPEQQLQTEPVSPQPSVDRLSVSFAADTPGGGGSVSTPGGSGSGSFAQTSPVAANPQGLTRSGCIMGVSGTGRGQRPPPLTLNGTDFKSRLAADTSDLGEEDEDYSASLSAIIQRRTSTLRRSRRRRPSSPFSPGGVQGGVASGVAGGVAGGVAAAAAAGTPTAAPGGPGFVVTPSATPAVRRRSSVFTTSSGDTGGSGDTNSQEEIMENLKLHKEVLLGVKQQPWGMRKKLKLVRQAKTYVKRHEGQLQQRRATRDVLARFNLFMLKKWQRFKREFANLLNVLLPWEARIKEIESHFGSVVASYFTFLRWLCWVNLVITVVTIAFIVVPEVVSDDFKTGGERKEMLPEERRNATHLVTLMDFGGILKYSPLFYGYYRDKEGRTGYRVPFAYFMTGLGLYVYSFVAILRKMAANSRMSKLSEKDDECVFTWKLFTGWDYMIGNAETAHNKVASTILGFKEALLEEAEKQREDRNWRIIAARIFVNLSVTILLATSAFAVVFAVQRSTEKDAESTLWRRNETTVIITIVNFLFPALFEVLGLLERYHPRKTLRLQLARIMLLNLLNLYTFIFSTFNKINDITNKLAPLEEDHRNQSLTASCSCKGSSGYSTIAAVALAISVSSRINSTTIGPLATMPISRWHPPPSTPTTFTALFPGMLTPPTSISTRSSSTLISITFTPPNSTATMFTPPNLPTATFTSPPPISTKNTPTSKTDTTYPSTTEGYKQGSSFATSTETFSSSSVGTSDENSIGAQTVESHTNTGYTTSALEQSLPEIEDQQYDDNSKVRESELNPEQSPLNILIAALLPDKYRPIRSAEPNILEDGSDESNTVEDAIRSAVSNTGTVESAIRGAESNTVDAAIRSAESNRVEDAIRSAQANTVEGAIRSAESNTVEGGIGSAKSNTEEGAIWSAESNTEDDEFIETVDPERVMVEATTSISDSIVKAEDPLDDANDKNYSSSTHGSISSTSNSTDSTEETDYTKSFASISSSTDSTEKTDYTKSFTSISTSTSTNSTEKTDYTKSFASISTSTSTDSTEKTDYTKSFTSISTSTSTNSTEKTDYTKSFASISTSTSTDSTEKTDYTKSFSLPEYETYSPSSSSPPPNTVATSTRFTLPSPITTHSSTTESHTPNSFTGTTGTEVSVPVSASTTLQTFSATATNGETSEHNAHLVQTSGTTDISPELTCPEEQCESEEKYHFKRKSSIDLPMRRKLNNLCWETMFGQELVKMTVTDLVMTVVSTLLVDFFRAVFVRVMNNCWCWDLEKRFPQYGDFKIAENILHLVNNQGMVWMGMFFSPGLALINVVKLAVMMYLRSWAVMTCNVPHEVVFRASRSNNFYLALLLTMLFLCVLPVGYAVVRLTPSWHCGPFSSYSRTYIIFTESLRAFVPKPFHVVLDYVASPGIVIPLLLLLSLVIYYLISLTNSLREANDDLKIQLRRERTEERRRMFQLVERRRRGATGSTDLTDKWKKLLPALPSTRDEESTADQPSGGTRPDNAARRKELLTRLLKHALRKSSATSDDESGAGVVDPEADGEGTDAEQPDSLPEDAPTKTNTKSGRSAMSQTGDQARRIRHQPSQPIQPPQGVTSPTASSHREREDSVTSAWSDNIPVIRISKTESTDCVVDLDQEEKNPIGSSDTVVAADELLEEEKKERRKAIGRAMIQEARRRRDSTRDDTATDEADKDNVKDDIACATSS